MISWTRCIVIMERCRDIDTVWAQFTNNRLVGVSIVGRPVSGKNQDTWVEVSRLCTDGTKNACSFLYSASARAAFELGYDRIQTYILAEESGLSLKASGWQFDRLSHPIGWHHDGDRPAREVAEHLAKRKQLWFKFLRAPIEREVHWRRGTLFANSVVS
jgi:hypothetical protein